MPADADERLSRVDHIVVVTMENRSFDQMLGFLSHPRSAVQPAGPRPDVDGLTGSEQVPLGPNVSGRPVTPTATTEDEFLPDPRHDYYSVALQVGAGGEMDGFIPSFRDLLLDSDDIRVNGPLDDETRIIRFQPAARVPTYAYLAHEFGVLDRYFCSFPGGTQPNRICMLTGRTPALTNAEITGDIGYLEDQTLFALLDRARVFWRYYEGDIGFIRAFKSYRTDFSRVRQLSEFLGRSRDDPMPSVTFIDPNFKEAPSELPAADDHAPTPVCRGQVLIRDIVARLMESRSWSRTLLIITYDEHGGFYDHVAPPGTEAFAAANPTVAEIPRVHPDVTRFGVRVPTMLVSPLIDVETVGHRIYDHTSVTRTILQRFVPDLVGYMPERVRRARHFGEVLRDSPRSSVPGQPEFPTGFECDGSQVRFSTPQSGVRYELSRRPADDERVQMQLLGVPMRPVG
jgi:phospholipase C